MMGTCCGPAPPHRLFRIRPACFLTEPDLSCLKFLKMRDKHPGLWRTCRPELLKARASFRSVPSLLGCLFFRLFSLLLIFSLPFSSLFPFPTLSPSHYLRSPQKESAFWAVRVIHRSSQRMIFNLWVLCQSRMHVESIILIPLHFSESSTITR